MTKKNITKRSLMLSGLSLFICISMLIGSTFAWFTDGVSSMRNIITAGNLDVELLANGQPVDQTTKLFDEVELWEPGVIVYENLQVVNRGTLALKYEMQMIFGGENDFNGHKLSEVLQIAVVDKIEDGADRESVVAAAKASDTCGSLSDFFMSGTLEGKTSDTEKGVVIFWEPQGAAIDNLYNVNNGQSTYDGQPLNIEFGVSLRATQAVSESDSFGNDYDKDAQFPEFEGNFKASVKISGKVGADNKLTEAVTIGKTNGINAIVPAGTLLNGGVTKLTLTVDTTNRSNNIEMNRGQVSRSLDVHIEGISEENTVPATIGLGVVMPVGLKDTSVEIYHVENGTPVKMTAVDTLTAHNQFIYNDENGEMTVNMATFSEVTAVVDAGDSWNGSRDTSWYNTTDKEFTITTEEQFAGFAAIVGGMADGIEQDEFTGKTVKLGANLDLGGDNGKVWYPIGYYNNLKSYEKVSGGSVTSGFESFEGTFDGQDHTISNIYQNTWDMFGDYNNGYQGTPNHYKDGMGIFGFVYNGTVKNLTVNNFQSDGELCTTGVVAAYASGSSDFENINIVNSNPRAYNVPNGGVVGYAYYNEGATNVINFNNVNVGTSNKITALWGSWDVGCGGILGRVNGATTVNMTNCEVGAEIDVFNDVCGNYQYYQYRYSGMLVGTVGGDSDPKAGPETVNFSNVKVYIGNWADYYYCEFEKNSQGSYTDDFQFSRVEKSDINFDPNTNLPYKENLRPCRHQHIKEEDKMGLYLPFNQLYTGYGWGSSPELITKYGEEVNGVTVYRSFYSVTYMTSDGKTVLDVAYQTVGERTDSKIWADEYTVKSSSISTPASNQKFNGWRNSSSVVKTKIDAGNRDDIVLYESWDNPFMARFVDINGNVIYSEAFYSDDKTIAEPAVPKIEGYTGQWEEYQTRINALNGDVTIHPIYLPVSDQGSNNQEIVDSATTAKDVFAALTAGKSVIMNGDIVGNGKDELGLTGGKVNLCEISGKKTSLNLNTFELTCNFDHNANKSWHIFDVNDGGTLTIGGGINREGTLKMNLKDVKSVCYVFALDSTSTLVLEAGVTIEINYPTTAADQVFAFMLGDKKETFENYDGIYVDKTTSGVLRITVGVTTTINGNTTN